MTKTMPNGQAPAGTKYAIGAKGGKVGQAWQLVWDRLSRDEYADAVELAAEVAESVGIKPISLRSHIHRMVHEGLIESTTRYADTTVTKGGKTYAARRKRTWVRIPADVDQAA